MAGAVEDCSRSSLSPCGVECEGRDSGTQYIVGWIGKDLVLV